MTRAHTEEAFERLIVEHLTGVGGYEARSPEAYDAELGLIRADLLGFVEETQPKAWARLRGILGEELEEKLLGAWVTERRQRGALAVLRHGFKFYGRKVRVATFRPAHGLNPAEEARYRANRVTVTRQVRQDPKRPMESVDLMLCVNGIPVATAELKNALTGQGAGDARRQYARRDPRAPLLRFKEGALVHFAVGSDEAWMTTRLGGAKTRFLPFNRGDGGGAGNAAVEGRHRTCYLWEEVWRRDSLMELVSRFVHLERRSEVGDDGEVVEEEVMIFPRYHQLDAVRRLVAAARERGAGHNFLVQHSAGSGKSNSIAWLAHRLASLHGDDDERVYDGVVVVTDRVVLDRQLQDTIEQIDHKQGVVQRIDANSAQLAAALEREVPIVITTLHKFQFVSDHIEHRLPERRYAIIVDEAHSSQSGEMAQGLKEVLGGEGLATRAAAEAEEDELVALDQAALQGALARGPQPNMSFFAFTATPKAKTLELFGHVDRATGKPVPFHLYSMRQAIEEGFILDVLRGYTTYTRYFELVKALDGDREVDRTRASRALARFVNLHPTNIAQKTEVIVEHFRQTVRPLLEGRAKAMVVASSRLAAVRYKQALDRYVEERGYGDVRALVAFSGEVKDPEAPGVSWTEAQMNRHPRSGRPIREKELPKAFAGEEFNVLLVANKYQTGFDQPLLCAMYVDKKLGGIQAVQTLSRLNRTHPGKEATFVLDFVNDREAIREAFKDYYEGTTTLTESDPHRLYTLANEVEGAGLLRQAEIDRFGAVFFKPRAAQRPGDNAQLNSALDPAVDRFKALLSPPEAMLQGLSAERREATCAQQRTKAERFRDALGAFCALYGFLAQVVPFGDASLEKLYVYGRMLLRKLPRGDEAAEAVELDEDVTLRHYRLKKGAEGALELAPTGAPKPVKGPTHTGGGGGRGEQRELLSRLIDRFNERFGTTFDSHDLLEGVRRQLLEDADLQDAARVNDRGNFNHVFEPKLNDTLIDRHARDGEFINAVFTNPEMREMLREVLLEDVYTTLHPQPEEWGEMLALLNAVWRPLAAGLERASVPPPMDVQVEATRKGQVVANVHAIMVWHTQRGKVSLMEVGVEYDDVDGDVVEAAPEAPPLEVAKRLRRALRAGAS